MKSIRDKFETCSGPGSEIRLKTSEKISKRLIKRLKERKKIMVKPFPAFRSARTWR